MLPALNSMHRQHWKLYHGLCVLKVFYCTFAIHHLAKEISLIITLHIFYDSLVHWFYEGHHIWRKVKNKNISTLQFKFMRVCIATIKQQYECCVFRLANLAEIFFHRGKRECVKTDAYRFSCQFRNFDCPVNTTGKYRALLTTHPI